MSKNNKLPFTKEFGYIRLARIIKPGSSKLGVILGAFGDIERINSLKYEDWAESGILSKAELSRVEKISSDEIYEVIKYCKLNDIRIITPEDKEYPRNFKYILDPPTVLYARGNKLDSSAPTIGIVGARKSSEFGQKAAYSLGAKLALSGFTVVSGGAVGVDSMAHTGAMNAGGSTIVVLGCGIDSDYLPLQIPLRKRAEIKGTVVSEFEPKSPATRYTFPIRNRIISALSCGVAVIEAGRKSGALITATYAIEQNKELFAIPGNINAPQYGGTNDLLRDGAIPLLKIEDIIEVYSGRFPDKLKSGIELSSDVKQGYKKEVMRLQGKTPSADNPRSDIKKDVEQNPENKETSKAKPKTTTKDRSKENPKENPKDESKKNPKDRSKGNPEITIAENEKVLPTTPTEEINCSKKAIKIYLSFTQNIEFSDILSERSKVKGGEFIAAVTELELFGFVKAIPVGRYERIK